MKTLLLCGVALSSITANAQNSTLPSFDEKLSAPELSLSESIKQESGQSTDDLLPKPGRPTVNPEIEPQESKIVSQMPIFVPGTDVDKNMPIVRPDPSTDHKLIVRKPLVESTGEVQLDDRNTRLAELRQRYEAERYMHDMKKEALREALSRKAHTR